MVEVARVLFNQGFFKALFNAKQKVHDDVKYKHTSRQHIGKILDNNVCL